MRDNHSDPGDESALLPINVADEKPLKTCCFPRNLYNLFILSFSFLLNSTGYNTTQTFATKLLPGSLGAISLGLLYAVFSVFNFVAPSVVHRLGPRAALFVGALGYLMYVGSLVYLITPLVLIAACAVGMGAAVIWTAQGVFLTQISNNKNRGTFTGIFFAIMQLNALPGNIASYFVLSSSSSSTTTTAAASTPAPSDSMPMIVGWNSQNSVLFLLLAGCCATGAFCFFLLQAPDPRTGTPASKEKALTAASKNFSGVVRQVKSTWRLLLTRRILLFAPLMFYSGISVTFWGGWFTRQQTSQYIGLCMTGLGVAEAIGGVVLGKVSDRVGRKAVLLFGVVAECAALFMSWYANKIHEEEGGGWGAMRFFFVAAPMVGLADCAFQTQIMAHIAGDYTESSADAFAIYKLMQSLGATLGFSLTPVFGTSIADQTHFLYEIMLVGGLMVIGMICYFFMIRIQPPNQNDKDVKNSINA